MAGYRITVRKEARVEREQADDLQAALGVLERRARELEAGAAAAPVGGRLIRRI